MGHVVAWHLSLIVPKEVWYGVEAKNMEPESEGLFFFFFFFLYAGLPRLVWLTWPVGKCPVLTLISDFLPQ